ncbi:MAG: tripartite tricarboxylate transporter substrate binding protein [Burkholderiales bacterium]|nr:tripartite tricarboxylate transporter substrate binding protein [Burkholderiales bacterium]
MLEGITRRRRHLRFLAATLIAASAAGLAAPAAANGWPNKPLRIIVSFPPGNSADLIAREVGPLLAQRLGQPVVIENRGGAGGVIGVEAVAKAAPDGYTLGMSSLSPITIIPATRRKMPYDSLRDITPVTLAAQGPLFLLVKKDSPIASLGDLIAQAKANGGKFTYGSLGTGTVSQMATEAFKAAAGVPLTEVPYKGSAQALTDLVGGTITLMFDGAASSASQIAAGNVRALGVTTLKRSGIVPDVPTLDESGLPGLKGFEAFGWIGLFAPGGTPKDIIARVQAEVSQILQTPGVTQRIRTAGLDVSDTNTPAQFGEFIQRDLARWTKIANDLKIVSD